MIVGIESDGYLVLNKGPHRPVFNQKLRAEALASLQSVDFVINYSDSVPSIHPKVFITRYQQLQPDLILFGKTESKIKLAIKKETTTSGCKLLFLPTHKIKSSTQISNLLTTTFAS